MKQLLLKTILLFFAIVCTNCSDNTEQPTGEDSFSFFINGELYIPEAGNGIGGGEIQPFSWYYSDFNEPNNKFLFNINGLGKYRVTLKIKEPRKGENFLNNELKNEFDTLNSGMIVQNETIFYNTKNNQNNGIITFTELSETKAVGTFECTLYNENGDKIKITDGKFNLSEANLNTF